MVTHSTYAFYFGGNKDAIKWIHHFSHEGNADQGVTTSIILETNYYINLFLLLLNILFI